MDYIIYAAPFLGLAAVLIGGWMLIAPIYRVWSAHKQGEAVAEQIKRIGEGLTKHDLYLKWQWIKMMEDRDGQTIYVPTEASIPILEASRRPFR